MRTATKRLKGAAALLLCLSLSFSALLAGFPAAASEAEPAVNLQYLNPSSFRVSGDSDSQRTFSGGGNSCGTAALTAEGVLESLPAAPGVSGWEFVGWYTAPVKYYFWGDRTTTAYTSYEPIPAAFQTNCDGGSNSFAGSGKSEAGGMADTLKNYWIWLSALDGSGRRVQAGDHLEDGATLYACYRPTSYTYRLDYNGWKGSSSVLSCTRQVQTPFGSSTLQSGDGYTFDGWYTAGGSRLDFYSVPSATTYYAHWHSNDGRVDQSNYTEVGTSAVTRILLYAGSNSGNPITECTLSACGMNTKTIYAAPQPAGSGVTNLVWKTSNPDVVQLESVGADSSLRCNIKAGSKAGTATVTVSTADGKVEAKLTVTVTEHSVGTTTITKKGNCSIPTQFSYQCAYCGKVWTESKITESHRYAYRDIPATCTTPHVWEYYCQTCGHVDASGNKTQSPAKGHNFKVSTTSGCGGAITTKTCTVCGYSETTPGNTGAHSWNSVATVDVRPTCYTEGSKSVKCSVCGAVKPGSSTSIPVDDSLHSWESWVVDKQPTETKEGQQTRVCAECGKEETRTMPPKGSAAELPAVSESMTMRAASDQVSDKEQAKAAVENTLAKLLGKNADGTGSGASDSMLADDILYAASLGKAISTEVRVTPVAAPGDAADAEKFSALLDPAGTVLYMDIDIIVSASGEDIGRITETADAVTFDVPLPAEDGRIVRVLRAHEGEIDELSCWVQDGSVYFTTDRFSTFAISFSNNIAYADVEAIPDQAFSGSAVEPKLNLTINGEETLLEGTDYTVTYANNDAVGTATAVITGMGDFAGTTKEVSFQILSRGAAVLGGFAKNDAGWILWAAFGALLCAAAAGAFLFLRRRKAAP